MTNKRYTDTMWLFPTFSIQKLEKHVFFDFYGKKVVKLSFFAAMVLDNA